MNNKHKTYKEYLSSLLSFLEAKDETTPYDVDQVLTDAGFKSNDVGKKFQEIAEQSMARSTHNWRNSAHIAYEGARTDYSNKISAMRPHRSRSEIMEAINALLSQQNLKVALAHRNFSDQTDEDLESLLDQLEFIASQKPKETDE